MAGSALGTLKDLELEKITPVEGMTLQFWMDDGDDAGNTDNLIFEGVIHFDKTLGRWYAVIDETATATNQMSGPQNKTHEHTVTRTAARFSLERSNAPLYGCQHRRVLCSELVGELWRDSSVAPKF